jgi:DNA polymerase III delta subunit
MKYTELKNDIKEGAKSIYLLEGDDAYFRQKGEEMIKSAFVSMPELNYSSFDGETLKGSALTSLVSALESFPFMSEKRLVKVSNFYPSESEFEHYLKKLFENFPADSILLIVNQEGKKGVDLKRKKIVTYVDCNRADEETVTKWAYITLKRANITASVEVCSLIARYCLCNMARVALEVEKIIDYKVSGELSATEVDELVYKDADYKMYELTNALSRRDFKKFCEIEGELCQKGGDELSLLSLLYSYFRNLNTIYLSRDSDAELAGILKMKEYGVKKSREQAKSIGGNNLKKYLTAVYGSISDIKNGFITPANALQNINNMLFFNND